MIKIGEYLYAGPEHDVSKFTVLLDIGPVERFVPPQPTRVQLDRDEVGQLRAECARFLHDEQPRLGTQDPIKAVTQSLREIQGVVSLDGEVSAHEMNAKLSDVYRRAGAMLEWLAAHGAPAAT